MSGLLHGTPDAAASDELRVYVARQRLALATSRAECVAAIEEIVISVVGCEEFAILECDAAGVPAVVLASHGEGAERHGDDAVARVPLVVGDTTFGMLVLHRLLPHKAGLDDGDEAVLQLLAAEAPRALRLVRPAARPSPEQG